MRNSEETLRLLRCHKDVVAAVKLFSPSISSRAARPMSCVSSLIRVITHSIACRPCKIKSKIILRKESYTLALNLWSAALTRRFSTLSDLRTTWQIFSRSADHETKFHVFWGKFMTIFFSHLAATNRLRTAVLD